MIYGYTLADAANQDIFENTIIFMEDKLHFSKSSQLIKDVDGSLKQEMSNGKIEIEIVSDEQVGYVAIKSKEPLSISCIQKWVIQ